MDPWIDTHLHWEGWEVHFMNIYLRVVYIELKDCCCERFFNSMLVCLHSVRIWIWFLRLSHLYSPLYSSMTMHAQFPKEDKNTNSIPLTVLKNVQTEKQISTHPPTFQQNSFPSTPLTNIKSSPHDCRYFQEKSRNMTLKFDPSSPHSYAQTILIYRPVDAFKPPCDGLHTNTPERGKRKNRLNVQLKLLLPAWEATRLIHSNRLIYICEYDRMLWEGCSEWVSNLMLGCCLKDSDLLLLQGSGCDGVVAWVKSDGDDFGL